MGKKSIEQSSSGSSSDDGSKSVISKAESQPPSEAALPSELSDTKPSVKKKKSAEKDSKKAVSQKSKSKSSDKKSKSKQKKSESKKSKSKNKQSVSKSKTKSDSKRKSASKHSKPKVPQDQKSSKGSFSSSQKLSAQSSEDGYKIKAKPETKEPKGSNKDAKVSKHSGGSSKKSSSKHSKHSSKGSKGSKVIDPASLCTMTSKEVELVSKNVRKVMETKGANVVTSEAAMEASGYTVEGPKIFSSDYSTVLRAKKGTGKSLVVKVINLAECSPRSRSTLLKDSVRIMRYISGAGSRTHEPLASVFVPVEDIFNVAGMRLFIFMATCDSNKSLYDMVKANQSLTPADIRTYFKSVATGVHQLQQIGVAHRAIKLQHILFDSVGNAKLVGWGKSVFYFDSPKNRIQLQRKERRVRRNYHLPPEAFMDSYNPAKADIWSLGVALVAMATKRYPFNCRDKKTKFSSQWREFIKNHELNTRVRNICHNIFAINPKLRISSKKLLEHPYFTADVEELKVVNCKGYSGEVREDSRVGGLSTIGMKETPAAEEPAKEKAKEKTKEIAKEAAAKEQTKEPAPKETVKKATADDAAVKKASEQKKEDVAEEAINWEEVQKEDKSGVDENATGFEGGNVGEEENLPPAEQVVESQVAENNAPEEAEAEAQPEEGEVVETAEAGAEAPEGGGGGAAADAAAVPPANETAEG
ncbi:PREDICTED: CBL-interacting protein kinase 30-like [Rhagoletis zephyria]|uniref:CBL-interacting protein kinase 30-like n=1 Tax=Rhagoletis zephyria TaxID=28612 RepID=UPI0008118E57|nr:PREDICTED: CBL-interacting protein kinase 30-like [Rhagoletis zephyria]